MACNSANNPASSSQGKKNRKTKGKKMELSVFLNEDTNKEAPDGYAVVTTARNWADYTVDDDEDKAFDHRRDIINHNRPIVLPTAPKSARAPDIDLSKIPNHPPFKAYLGNLPYETTEEEIERFFKNKKVARVHLVRDGDRGRPRGVGFVEFEDRETLIDALGQNGETLKNRAIRVSISEDRGSGYEDRSRRIDEDRTSNDWRSDTRELPPARNGNDYPSYDNDSYRGRRMDRSSGGFDRSYNRERDFGDVRSEPRDFNRFDRDSRDNNFQDNKDRGPRDSYGRGDRSFDDRRERRSFDDRREGRGFDGRGFEGRGFDDRRDGRGFDDRREGRGFEDRREGRGFEDRRDGRGFDDRRDGRGFDGGRDDRRYERRQYDRQDDRRGGGERSMGSDHGSDRGSERGYRDRPLDKERRNFSSNFDRRSSAASPSPPVSTDSRGEDEQREPPKERPRLMLQPRTKPLQDKVEQVSDSAIFGGAKPVDTAARERQIEEKLQASLRLERDLEKTSRGSAAGSGPNSERGSIVGDGDNGRDSPASSPRLSQSQSEAERVEPQRNLD